MAALTKKPRWIEPLPDSVKVSANDVLRGRLYGKRANHDRAIGALFVKPLARQEPAAALWYPGVAPEGHPRA